MSVSDSRRHARCESNTAVTLSFVNQSAEYAGIAKNYSEGGMYVETAKPLRPGTLIQIRPAPCEAPQDERASQPFYCAGVTPDKPECRQLKMLVVGEVRRCDALVTTDESRYGLAISYVSPAV